MVTDINARIAAEISWARMPDRTARTRPARQTFLKRFEKEVELDGTVPPEERRQRAEHANRAYSFNSPNDRLARARRGSQRSRARHRPLSFLPSGTDLAYPEAGYRKQRG
jgi:hypothetical protein